MPNPTDPPDYTSAVYWLAHPIHHPTRVRGALPKNAVRLAEEGKEPEVVQMELEDPQDTPAADVFYLHGTMEWQGNKASIGRYETESWVGFNTHHQMTMLTAFTGSCQAYAPLYRQAAAGGSWEKAYEDVAAAFEQFVQETGPRRPMILAGHSQGAMHLATLVRERVAKRPALVARLAGIYAPGMSHWIQPSPLPVEDGTVTEAPPLASVAIWATVSPTADRQKTLVGRMSQRQGVTPAPCADPTRWTSGQHLGALLRDGNSLKPAVFRDLVSRVELRDGLVRVEPRRGAEAILEPLSFGSQDYHAFDIHLFWANVRERVRQQVAAALAKQAAAS